MKKTTKQILSLLLVALMAVSLFSAAAFASGATNAADTGDTTPTKNDSITIKGAKVGETYKLYKLFDLKVNNEITPNAYSYTVNSAWKTFFEDTGAKYVTINDEGYVTEIKNEVGEVINDNASDLAAAAAAWAKSQNLAAIKSVTVGDSANTAVFESLENGYWLITSTLGTQVMTDTTPAASAVEINEKNPEDTIEKTVKEDSTGNYEKENDAQIGDTVEFKSIATLNLHTRNVKIHDTMSEGLTFTAGSIKIYTDADLKTELAAANYTIQDTPDTNDTFTIQISDSYVDGLSAAQMIYITYTATLNEKAVKTTTSTTGDGDNATTTTTTAIVDQKNTTKITYGDNQSNPDETTTTTHKFSVFKHATNSNEYLAGAVFKLKKAGTALQLIKLDDNNYRVAKSGETGAVDTFTTVASGDIVIWGVDSDSDYTLEEVTPPEGYNKLKSEVTVTVNADNNTRSDVENKSGTELPSTGGIGTTLFYVIGGLLVVGAGAVLVTKKRLGKDA